MSDRDSPSSDIGRKRRLAARGQRSHSESSGGSLIASRKKRIKRVEESESSDSGSEVENRRRRRKGSDSKPVIASESESDSGSVGDGLACPICLGRLYEATLQGRPDSCEHTFCIECITAWSKNNSTCPLCRNAFSAIKVSLRGSVLEELPVKKAVPQVDEADPNLNDILCLICHRADREDTLLLCDECDDAYHCACLSPPLLSVPIGQWFCPRCNDQNVDAEDDDDDFSVQDENFSLYAPRTRATERVRRSVQSTRRTATTRTTSRSTSGRGRRGTTRASTNGRAATNRKRRTTGTKRKKTRRKTTRRRKGGRRLAILRKAYAASTDVQLRIGRSLGLPDRVLHKLNRNNVSFPVLSTDEPSTSRGTSSRADSSSHLRARSGVGPSLTIFGDKNDYEPHGSSDDGGVTPNPKEEPQTTCNKSSTIDFLGGLLEKQSVLLDKTSELKMDSQGTLRLVGSAARAAPSTSSQKRSSESTTSAERVKKPAQPPPRASSSSLEYDTRYKPQRISRVDETCVAAVADTIEEVVKKSHAQRGDLEEERSAARAGSNRRQGSSVAHPREPTNFARDRGLTETQGWINSLRLTVPTVMNSLSVFQDLDDAQPSCSSSNPTSNHRRVEVKSEHIRVKEEPKTQDECSERHNHRDQKKYSHHSDSRRDEKPDRSNESRSSARYRRSPSYERNRNHRKSRSRSPRAIKRERLSRERSRSPKKSSSDYKLKYRRSRSPSQELSHRRENSDRCIKKEKRFSPRPASIESTKANVPDALDVRLPVNTKDDLKSAEPLAAVDLSKVKIEPVEFSQVDDEPPQTSSASPGVVIKVEPGLELESTVPTGTSSEVDGLPSERTMQTSSSKPVGIEFPKSYLDEAPQVPVKVEVQSSIESDDAPVSLATANCSHMEGYSSGMDSEESFSDVERAVPGVVPEEKPAVKKSEPKKYVKYFVPREKFKDAVIKEVGPYLKKFYKKHQISKEDYKEIFKKVIKKVCTSSSEKKRLVCTKAIHRLCHTYVKRARIQIKLDCKFGEGV